MQGIVRLWRLGHAALRTTFGSRFFSAKGVPLPGTLINVSRAPLSTEETSLKRKNLEKAIAESPVALSATLLSHVNNRSWAEIEETCNLLTVSGHPSRLASILTTFVKLKRDNAREEAFKTVRQFEYQSLQPVESRLLADLCDQLQMSHAALKHINDYLTRKECKRDSQALLQKAKLANACGKHWEALKSCRAIKPSPSQKVEIRTATLAALKGLNKLDEAVIEVSLWLGEASSVEDQGVLHCERAACRPADDIAAQARDLRACYSLCPSLRADKKLLLLYYNAGMLELANEVLEVSEKAHGPVTDFDMMLIKADICEHVRQDAIAALTVCQAARSSASQVYLPILNMKIKQLQAKTIMKLMPASTLDQPKPDGPSS